MVMAAQRMGGLAAIWEIVLMAPVAAAGRLRDISCASFLDFSAVVAVSGALQTRHVGYGLDGACSSIMQAQLLRSLVPHPFTSVLLLLSQVSCRQDTWDMVLMAPAAAAGRLREISCASSPDFIAGLAVSFELQTRHVIYGLDGACGSIMQAQLQGSLVPHPFTSVLGLLFQLSCRQAIWEIVLMAPAAAAAAILRR